MADLGVEIIRRKKEEVQVMDRENMGKTTIVLAPLAAGVSKMLERIGEGQYRLIITVERV